MSLEIGDDIPDPQHKVDYRRANGAPMIVDKNGKNQRYARPSGFGKELDDENALVAWKINRAIEGVAGDPALQARAVAAQPDDRATWKELREASINAGRGDQAADIGTALHAMSERWEDQSDDFTPGSPYVEHLTAYTDELERLGLRSVHVEVHMVNDEYRAAGTADRIYEATKRLVTPHGEIIEPGTLLLGDLKTGKTLTYSQAAYSVQMAVYAGGELYDPVEDVYLETPPINQGWGILVHLPSDDPRCEALWVDLEVGRWGAYLVQQVRLWRKNWRSDEFSCQPIQVLPDLPGETITVEEADAEIDEWMDQTNAWVKDRIKAIGQRPEARKHLITFWPKDLPTPKQGISKQGDMLALLEYLDKVEAEHELPFVPNPIKTTGHKSTVAQQQQPASKEDES